MNTGINSGKNNTNNDANSSAAFSQNQKSIKISATTRKTMAQDLSNNINKLEQLNKRLSYVLREIDGTLNKG